MEFLNNCSKIRLLPEPLVWKSSVRSSRSKIVGIVLTLDVLIPTGENAKQLSITLTVYNTLDITNFNEIYQYSREQFNITVTLKGT